MKERKYEKRFLAFGQICLSENFVINQIINQTYRREIGHINAHCDSRNQRWDEIDLFLVFFALFP